MKGLEVLTIFSAVVALTAADGGRISISVDLQSQCLGREDGVFLPVRGSCTQYLVCIEGTAVLRTCGNYHFDARRSVCDLPANAGCISFGPFPLPIAEVVCFGKNDGSRIAVSGSKNKFFFCMHGKAALHNCGTLLFDERKQKCVVEIEQPQLVPQTEQQQNPEPEPEPQLESQPEPQPHPTPEESPCEGAINGARLPVHGNIRQYYLCINNRPFLKNCGNMYFNAEASACALMPEQQDTPSIKVPPNQTDNQAVLPPQQLPGKDDLMVQKLCQGKRLGARVALPGSCTEYYICMGQTAIPKSCGNLQFNPINMACAEPSSVRCKAHANGVIYGAADSVAQPDSTSAEICQGRRDGIFLSAPGKCSEFYFCFKNKSYRKTCGPKRHFSPITLSCVELEESNCVEPVPAAPAVQVPVVAANSCLTRANGALLRHPSVCGKFLICDNNRAVEMDCPEGLHFNTELNVCDWPSNAKCI